MCCSSVLDNKSVESSLGLLPLLALPYTPSQTGWQRWDQSRRNGGQWPNIGNQHRRVQELDFGSLQSKAREVGVRFKGLSKEQLIEALEGVRLQDDAEEGSSQQMEVRLQPEEKKTKSQWVVWYEEELALLGEEATIDDKREAIHRAEEREAIHRAEEREREANHRAQEMALLERQIALEAARSSRQTLTPAPTMRELPRVSRKDFKPFNEAAGDIEGFFQDFEHQCRLMEVPERDRVRHLMGLLEGGAAAAYRAMDPQGNCEYAEIKRTILEHYAVTPDTYRTQFRTLACDEEVSFKMYAQRPQTNMSSLAGGRGGLNLGDLPPGYPKRAVFYFKCPAEIREWVRERRPATVEEAAALADEALTIKPQWRVLLEDGERPTSSTTPVAPCSSVPIVPRSSKPLPHADTRVNVPPVASNAFSGIRRGEEVAERRCYGCGHPGICRPHAQSPWRSRPQNPTAPSGGGRPPGSLTPRPRGRLGWSETQHRCYRCGQPGHLQASCPAVQMRIDPVPSRIINYVQPSAMEDDVSPLREDWPCASPTHVAPLGVYGVRPAAMTTSAHRAAGKQSGDVARSAFRLTDAHSQYRRSAEHSAGGQTAVACYIGFFLLAGSSGTQREHLRVVSRSIVFSESPVHNSKHTGRPRKTSKRQNRKLKAICLQNRKYTTKQMRNEWEETGVIVCDRTTSRVVNSVAEFTPVVTSGTSADSLWDLPFVEESGTAASEFSPSVVCSVCLCCDLCPCLSSSTRAQKGKERKKAKADSLYEQKKSKKEVEFEQKLAKEKEEMLEKEKQLKISRLVQEVSETEREDLEESEKVQHWVERLCQTRLEQISSTEGDANEVRTGQPAILGLTDHYSQKVRDIWLSGEISG
ncbi:unnamed protein product [Ranitomeya imitator]|uniref:CCHC-type domain-containing protein n=1 Tax=Ranitomeya imitator TaxID=111125 RepID=A0ABN9MMV9_9NEOB|nr:unnamed protein product [Ranitomeya imitator]